MLPVLQLSQGRYGLLRLADGSMGTIIAPPARSARFRARDIMAVEAKGKVEACIGEITAGMGIFAVTRGQFAMVDVIRHCLAQMGPSRVTLWTWCIADYEFQTFEWLLEAGAITSACLVIDRSGQEQMVGKTRSDESRGGVVGKLESHSQLMRRWKAKFGDDSIKVCHCHAKLATVSNDEFKLVIHGSMNLNHNPRWEQFSIYEGGGPFEMVRRCEEEMVAVKNNYTRRELDVASGFGRVFTPSELRTFRPSRELKVWKK